MSQQHQKEKAAFFNFHINFTLFIILQFISQSKAGSTELDQIISVLLKTNMAVGGVTAAILDNLLPGSREERGLDAWKSTRNFDCLLYTLFQLFALFFGSGKRFFLDAYFVARVDT